MGGWKMEVFRMSLYMTFPVALFYYFNQPEYFEEWVKKTRREIYPPEDLKQAKMYQDAIREVEKLTNQQLLAELEKQEKN